MRMRAIVSDVLGVLAGIVAHAALQKYSIGFAMTALQAWRSASRHMPRAVSAGFSPVAAHRRKEMSVGKVRIVPAICASNSPAPSQHASLARAATGCINAQKKIIMSAIEQPRKQNVRIGYTSCPEVIQNRQITVA
ncbi:MAG: hypothetical protein NW215_04980 [Hyphomicrobiales bacterium]|nr:hypothetical protein [Hyphomicrobiales bacterium]